MRDLVYIHFIVVSCERRTIKSYVRIICRIQLCFCLIRLFPQSISTYPGVGCWSYITNSSHQRIPMMLFESIKDKFTSVSATLITTNKERSSPHHVLTSAWWRHQLETFSELLALCAENSQVTGEFPAQRPVTRSFDVFFYLSLNKRLSEITRRRWFATPLRLLWRHCNGAYHH